MPIVNSQFIQDFETNSKILTIDAYTEMAKNIWIWDFMAERSTESRREVLTWLLSTAMLEEIGESGGSIDYESIEQVLAEYTTKHHGKALEVERAKFEDLDGNGIEVGSAWMSQIGAYMAYYPQKLGVAALKDGETGIGYDKKPFFATDHPVNPNGTVAGTYANLFTGAAAGAYPGACPIDESVSADVAFSNLQKVIAYIRTIKGPNGQDPRFLRPLKLAVGPRLQGRAVQLTNATFIAQTAAGGGAGSAEIKQIVEALSLVQPIVADELDQVDDGLSYFIGCKDVAAKELSGLVYMKRKDFEINYYAGQGSGATGLDAVLARTQKFEWQCRGRMAVGYGHPHDLHKVKKT
jgi:phage major head subunit gpT-like protein